jgi:hypothetical protein
MKRAADRIMPAARGMYPQGESNPCLPSRNSQPITTCDEPAPRPDRALTIAIPETAETDPDLAALLAVWDRLPEGGRTLLRQTAEALTGTLPRNGKGR